MAEQKQQRQVWHFVVPGDPIGKPRMTQRDKWQRRTPVMRYRAWADEARRKAPKDLPPAPLKVWVIAYFSIPQSWPKKRRLEIQNHYHRSKPDGDNVLKSVCDALFSQDKCIAEKRIEKRYDDGMGTRVEISVIAF